MMTGSRWRWILPLGAALLLLPGCTDSSTKDTLQLVVAPGPRAEIVNLTANDVAQYPPLEQLVRNWTADGKPSNPGNLHKIPYVFPKAMELVDAIRARQPSKFQGLAEVSIRYQGVVFDLVAAKYFSD